MNKKYLMKGMAALALLAGFSSCVKDVDGSSSGINEEQKAKENAELQLGFMIPDGQTWDMASQVEAKVTVNGDFGTDYTVTIFENNPLLTGSGVVLDKTTVKSGNNATLNFSCPNSASILFASIKDAKGYTYVKPVSVENNKITAVFGDAASASRSLRAASSTNSHVNIPTCTVTNDYVQSFLTDAKEPTDANVVDNYDNSRYETNWDVVNAIAWDGSEEDMLRRWFTNNGTNNGMSWEETIAWALANRPNWIKKINDENYVTKFKITGTWDKLIGVLPTEEKDGDARTVYVSGTWTIPAGEEQRVGGGAVIVIVEGGEIVIPEGSQLNFVNQARLVNAGGTISGAGTINVTNGNNPGEEGYNSGTISIGKFNQNFGTFFNYGTFANYATELNGGAGTSTFVNHGHMYIKGAPKGSSSANMQIKNACWFEASGEVACKLIENASGAYFKAGALDLSSSEGGEGIGTYIAMDTNSSMVITGAVKLNSTLIYGPESGESAYMEFDNISFLNVGEVYPINGNLNLYVGSFVGGNGDAERFEASWNRNLADGDGKPQVVGKAAFNTAPTDPSDCAPGFTPNIPVVVNEEKKVYTYAFEDQTLNTDYDLNDVVLKVNYHVTETNEETGEVVYDKTQLDVQLVAAGATYEIKAKIGDAYLFGGKEIHQAMRQNKGVMINTGGTGGNSVSGITPAECTVAVPEGWNGEFAELPVSIEVSTTNKTYAFPNDDIYPHVVMIPVDWAWPIERVNIKDAYPGTADANDIENSYTATYTNKETNELVEGSFTMTFKENSFAAWATSAAADRVGDRNGWYNYPSSAKTMKNN